MKQIKKLTHKQRITTSLIALTFVLGTALWTVPAFAQDYENKAHFKETKQAIHEAITNSDYEAFAEIASETPFAESISEETFAKLVEAHALREAGDKEGARAIMEELGIKKIGHKAHFRGDGSARIELTDEERAEREAMREERREHREAVRAAIEAEDYDAWVALVEGRPVTDLIDEDNFDGFIDAHELRASGDKEGFKEAMETLGFDFSDKEFRGEQFRSGGGFRD